MRNILRHKHRFVCIKSIRFLIETPSSPEIVIKLATTLGTSIDYLLGMEKGRIIDINGLADEDENAIRMMFDLLRAKNQSKK